MRALIFMSLLPVLLATLVTCAPSSESDIDISEAETIVLVLVEDLTWKKLEDTPALAETFEESAVANLSTAQGVAPVDPRMSYVLLGAGSRADTSLLPGRLPADPSKVPGALESSAAGIKPGALGETITNAGLQTATIGDLAGLVAMNREGEVSRAYDASDPTGGLESALEDGAELVVVEATNVRQAGRLAETAEEAGATTAVASPAAPAGTANLTPFALGGSSERLLYSTTTRTEGLVTSTDVAPTLLALLGLDPPPEMQGRPATLRPGQNASAERLGELLSFVTEKRTAVWVSVSAGVVLCLLLATLRRGTSGARFVLLLLSALPAAALVSAASLSTNTFVVAALILLFGGALTALSWRFCSSTSKAVASVYLVTAALILADATAGGTLMKFSTLGYNPAYGTRFYGIGNEYAAFLAGSLTMGVGALAHRRRVPLAALLVAGLAAVVVLGLPTMGADVGGSLALGAGFGATVGLLRGAGLRGMVLWAAGGLFLAAALFLLSGSLFPGVSHGSRAAGGETELAEVVVRKLLLSLDLLLNPLFLVIFVAALAVIFLGWRRVRGTALAAGLLGATVTALASGALNDSGILAAIYALAYPAVAAGVLVLSNRSGKRSRVR